RDGGVPPMTTDIGHAIGYLPFPLCVTATPDHVVVSLNAPGRRVLGDILGRPVCEALPHPGLLTALDAAYHEGRPSTAVLSDPPVSIGCAPVPNGVLMHMASADTPSTEARSRAVALQRLAGELSGAATPTAIGGLAVTTAA